MERKTKRRVVRYVAAFAVVVVVTAASVVIASAAGDVRQVSSFERSDRAFSVQVQVGTALEDAGLPERLRAEVKLPADADSSEFVQMKAPASTYNGDGNAPLSYVAPADAAERYAAGETVVYTVEGQEGSFRVYGYLENSGPDGTAAGKEQASDGSAGGASSSGAAAAFSASTTEAADVEALGAATLDAEPLENPGMAALAPSVEATVASYVGRGAWYACDEEGTPLARVEEAPVTWVSGSYRDDVPGIYKAHAVLPGNYTYTGSLPSAEIEVTDDESGSLLEGDALEQGEGAPLEEDMLLDRNGFLSLREAFSSLDSDLARLESFSVTKVIDGTPDFDTSTDANSLYYRHRVGNDESSKNGIVRSFDTVGYDLRYRTVSYNPLDTFAQGVMRFEFVLPMSADEAEWETSSMTWADAGSLSTTERIMTYDFNGDGAVSSEETNVACQVLRGSYTIKRSATNPTAIPGSGTLLATVQVLGAPNGAKVTPVFTAWLDHNHAGSTLLSDSSIVPTGNTVPCAEHGVVEQKTAVPSTVSVTAEPRYNVQLREMPDSYTSSDTYDMNLTNGKALDYGWNKITGSVSAFGVTLQLYNHPDRKMKGIEIPTGNITFDMSVTSTFVPASGTLSAADRMKIAYYYYPFVLSWGSNNAALTIEDGRDVKENFTFPNGAAPLNSGMQPGQTNSASCYQGGSWNAVKNGSVVSFTISDYEIKYPLFPQGTAPIGSGVSYYNAATGLANIGAFSAGKIYVLQTHYNLFTGTHVLDDLNLAGDKDGSFHVAVSDYNLRATSISGQSLPVVTGNTNQAVTNDDALTSVRYMKPTGGYEPMVLWTNYSSQPHLNDVLGRLLYAQGNWAGNGLDTLTCGAPVGIMVGGLNNESSDARNRLAATDTLVKFDSRAVALTGNWKTSAEQVDGLGWTGTMLFATKSDGSHWSSDAEMNATRIEQLRYYPSLSAIPAGHNCVGVLLELRPKNNNPANVIKYPPGTYTFASAEGYVKNDPALVGNVYQCCVAAKVWRVQQWPAGGIPTLLGNNPQSPTALPPTYAETTRQYTKTTYNPDGTTSGHTGSWNYGDSLHIVKALTNVSKTVEQREGGTVKSVFSLDGNQRYVDFALSPSFSALPAGVSETTTVTISDTLGKGLSYVSGTTTMGGTYVQSTPSGLQGSVTGGISGLPYEPAITANPDGTTTLTWVFQNTNTSLGLPVIHYSALIGTPNNEDTDVEHNDTLDNMVDITSTGDFRPFEQSTGNRSKVSIRVSKLQLTALTKASDQPFWDPGDTMGYTMSIGNNGSTVYRNTFIMDTLPSDGDALGSSFDGPLVVDGLTFDPSTASNVGSWKGYYTVDPQAIGTISGDHDYSNLVAANKTTLTAGGATLTWVPFTINADGTTTGLDGTTPTAVAFLGDLRGNETLKAHMGLRAPQAKSGDVFANRISRNEEYSDATASTVSRSISGVVWNDSDRDGIRESGEAPLAGPKVQLLKKTGSTWAVALDDAGNEIYVDAGVVSPTRKYALIALNNNGVDVAYTVSATGLADGGYVFEGLPAGAWGVRFVDGADTPLGKYAPSPADVGSDDALDSDGVPTYSDGTQVASPNVYLVRTDIQDIELPTLANMTAQRYHSPHHDQGLYERDGSATIVKKDDNGEVLADVKFKLEKKNAGGGWDEVSVPNDTTGADGRLVFGDLAVGDYRLTETATPAGHQLLAGPIEFTLPYKDEDGTATGTPSYVVGGTNYYLHLTFTVENGQVLLMPTAGDEGLLSPAVLASMGAAALVLIAAGGLILMRFRARRRRIGWALGRISKVVATSCRQ